MDERMDALENSQAAVISALNDVEASVMGETFKNRTILFIGDSWGAGWNPDEGTVTSPETVCANYLQPEAYYRKDEGGAGFAYANGHWYGKLLEDFVDEQSAEVVASITDIIITGGQNDLGDSADYVDTNTLYEAKWTANFIATNFPNARVYLGMVARTSGFNSDATYGNLNRTIDRYKLMCTKYNWHYISNSHLMVHDYSMLSSDGKHLLEAGYIKLGLYLAQSLLSGYWSSPMQGAIGLNIAAAADTTGSLINGQVTDLGLLQMLTAQGVLLFNNTNKIWEITNDTDIASNSNYVLCDYGQLPANYFKLLYRMSVVVPVVVVHEGAASNVFASLYFSEDGKIYLKLTRTSDNGQNWATFQDVSRIIFQPFSVTIPLDYC